MDLAAYLTRISYDGPTEPSEACLRALHRHHSVAIPYENLDVQLQRPVVIDEAPIFDKIVEQGRGGWCYENNGLFNWALREIGFSTTRMVGGVHVAADDWQESMGSHLVVLVELDEPWVADVGLGATLLEPLPLRPGVHEVANRRFTLEQVAADRWRFTNDPALLPPMFDFWPRSDDALLTLVGHRLQTDPESMFRQNLICQRLEPTGEQVMLIGRVLTLPGEEQRTLADAQEFVAALDAHFDLRDEAFESLWPQVVARHDELFGSSA